MKKFQFTLDRMLGYKNQLLDKEKNVLGQIKKKQAEIDQKIHQLSIKRDDLSAELVREQEKGTTVAKILGYSLQIENIRYQLEALSKEKAAMEQEAERQTKVVIAASQEVSSLEKLQEKQLEQYHYEAAQAERENVLEYVTTQLVRNRKEE